MIPIGGAITDETLEAEQQPSRTYRLDIARGRVTGMTDGLDAVKQAVFKILQTERFRYEIYSFDYGHELSGLVGGNPLFVRSEASRRIQEALSQDDRITGIQEVVANVSGDSLSISFTVATLFGSFDQTLEVGMGV